MTPVNDPLPDPGGVQAAIDRYRDLSKYLIATFAAVGATLVAGTQLSSVGELSWSHDPDRVIAASVGFAVAIVAVIWTVSQALAVLRPIEMSLDDVAADKELSADIDAHSAMLGGLKSVSQLQRLLGAHLLSAGQREAWQGTVRVVIGRAAYRLATKRFERAWRGMLIGSLLGIFGIVAFVWGANPPGPQPAGRTVEPTPIPVALSLTPSGQRLLDGAAGRECGHGILHGLAIGGTRQSPEIVTLPGNDCRPVRLVLAPSLGIARSTGTVRAP